MARILFILKAREAPYTDEAAPPEGSNKYLSSGLMNSASFVKDMLAKELGHTVELVHAIDNNCIDKLVTTFKPNIVIIEAYWVVPEKFEVLHKLHPSITWVIRNHSALPFLANEGMAMEWTLKYMDQPNVMVCSNDPRADAEFQSLVRARYPTWTDAQIADRVYYLPNYYPVEFQRRAPLAERDALDICCFGALRPLKNQLIQAVAAIQFAEAAGKTLRFHINGTRIEMKGEPIYHSLKRMFALLPHELIEHPWLPHEDFCRVLQAMDLSMQVSYTETFNIVTADAVVNDVPVVTSPDISWVHPLFHADPNDSNSIRRAMGRAMFFGKHFPMWRPNLSGLDSFDERALIRWDGLITQIMAQQPAAPTAMQMLSSHHFIFGS